MSHYVRTNSELISAQTDLEVLAVGKVEQISGETLSLILGGADGPIMVTLTNNEFIPEVNSFIEIVAKVTTLDDGISMVQVDTEPIMDMGADFDLELYNSAIMCCANPQNNVPWGLGE